MFDAKISLLKMNMPVVSTIILIMYILIGFLIKNILIFTLKEKYKKRLSWNYSGIKMAKQYLEDHKNFSNIMLSKQKIFNLFSKNLILSFDEQNNSSWYQLKSIFKASKHINIENKKYGVYFVLINLLTIASIIFMFIPINAVMYSGFIIFITILFINLLTIIISKKIIKNIYDFLGKNINENDKIILNKIFKYYYLYFIFKWITFPGELTKDIFIILRKKAI